MKKSNGEPLNGVVWIEEDGKGNAWILRSNGSHGYHPTSAFHRHERAAFDGGPGVVEVQLNTQISPGWVCRWCHATASDGLQLGWNFTNWEDRT